jgi:hypothetical protein
MLYIIFCAEEEMDEKDLGDTEGCSEWSLCSQISFFFADLLFQEFTVKYKTLLERHQEILNYQLILSVHKYKFEYEIPFIYSNSGEIGSHIEDFGQRRFLHVCNIFSKFLKNQSTCTGWVSRYDRVTDGEHKNTKLCICT